MALTKGFEDVVHSRPLFLTIYTVVVVGIVVSSLYIFSAFYSNNNPSSFLSSFSSSSSSSSPSGEEPHLTDQILNVSQSKTMHAVSSPAPEPQNVWTRPTFDVPPHNKKMPPMESFRLTKELVQQRVKDNIIIVTFGNYAFMDFILTWVKHLTELGLTNYLVGAMDTKLLEALYWKGLPVFDMGSHMSTIDVGWGSPTFHKMGREKVILINSMLPFGYELLMCDTDMVWLKNPLPYIAHYPEADVLTSSDQVVPTVVDDSLEVWQEVGAAYNIGIFHWRPTESAKKLAKEWKELLLADEKIWDQTGFNDIVHRQLGPSVDDESGLVYAYDGNLKLGILPASIFCSGHTYFVQAMHQQLRLEPYAVHTTFQYAGTAGKRHRLREAMLFYDPPEYYNPPGGFLSFKPSIPKSLLLIGNHTIGSHFTLINYQMKQIRTALAIASLLNRTLVMPPLWCRIDRLWFPHPGVLEGSITRQPFLCPLDHVFEVDVMLRELPEEEFGPKIDIREYSILENSALPAEVKKSWLNVQLCKKGTKDCNASNNTTVGGALKFPKHSNEETFIEIFSSFKHVKVIQLSSVQDAFTGFTDKEREQSFRKRVKHYVGIWCCVLDHTPGHIYYDMYWDEKPGWKPIPPQTSADDHPPW
ncbi:PREDICTED: arabinosyltransferase XEG113-like isoform X2 [Lupinus angustifolius]|uniref:arabinosyltransferase XEG113-like isoform X1 n=1 Tax=Lupinus angustifolius TaxID=3871 RepID=UPI00092E55C1|nr:PREDICTED: arabinosyltransferase XEG113-like isoform X1 [Lupinus angustifolius]XP_019445118.1 PREDICTED: arabinosyltransferase XEG113-like isoform X2 [Lupinus angustifolius]